ncbi:MAG: GT4 family glycosyltransferase PelF [bacterium]|nr:GT4 family glycosyltransferase PelF [bacterium]MBU1919149.1 GT4 family glycosyltransferase PelF [bacterium]
MSDVCLVLEGTYPYVRGGVSTWVHQLITAMPEIKFSLISIMPTPNDTKIERYNVPTNVESICHIYLHDFHFQERHYKKTPKIFDFFRLFLQGIELQDKSSIELFLLERLKERQKLNMTYSFYSRDFWKATRKLYEEGDPSVSFLDFFWNYRFTFLPIMQLIKAEIPPAPLYHTISTGYAGIMASLAKIKFNSNMIATEHGIYTKERRIEIAQASWLYEKETEYIKAISEFGFFKDWWMHYFEVMSKITYMFADEITTLYNGNKISEIEDGAEAHKISIIPNGVDVKMYEDIANSRPEKKKRNTIAFIGRVVPIKDVKTFIKACKIISQRIEDIRILILGPQDEESQYYQECSLLIKTMGLSNHVIFTGHVDIRNYLKNIDLLVLTSISEAQPLVILEGNACGIPIVATDVGSCRELLEGKDADDRMLGESGIITEFHSPEKTADAVVKILSDEELYQKMAKAGLERTRTSYNFRDMIVSYRTLYEEYI